MCPYRKRHCAHDLGRDQTDTVVAFALQFTFSSGYENGMRTIHYKLPEKSYAMFRIMAPSPPVLPPKNLSKFLEKKKKKPLHYSSRLASPPVSDSLTHRPAYASPLPPLRKTVRKKKQKSRFHPNKELSKFQRQPQKQQPEEFGYGGESIDGLFQPLPLTVKSQGVQLQVDDFIPSSGDAHHINFFPGKRGKGVPAGDPSPFSQEVLSLQDVYSQSQYSPGKKTFSSPRPVRHYEGADTKQRRPTQYSQVHDSNGQDYDSLLSGQPNPRSPLISKQHGLREISYDPDDKRYDSYLLTQHDDAGVPLTPEKYNPISLPYGPDEPLLHPFSDAKLPKRHVPERLRKRQPISDVRGFQEYEYFPGVAKTKSAQRHRHHSAPPHSTFSNEVTSYQATDRPSAFKPTFEPSTPALGKQLRSHFPPLSPPTLSTPSYSFDDGQKFFATTEAHMKVAESQTEATLKKSQVFDNDHLVEPLTPEGRKRLIGPKVRRVRKPRMHRKKHGHPFRHEEHFRPISNPFEDDACTRQPESEACIGPVDLSVVFPKCVAGSENGIEDYVSFGQCLIRNYPSVRSLGSTPGLQRRFFVKQEDSHEDNETFDDDDETTEDRHCTKAVKRIFGQCSQLLSSCKLLRKSEKDAVPMVGCLFMKYPKVMKAVLIEREEERDLV